ncbi:MAG: hypothetical protein K2M78_07190 [Lachnospiraceae bacterium]|nr:hypothetical protein [Lachnospiraceae bacterium]
MENFDKELLKWEEASKEIEEETREILRIRHRLWITFLITLAAMLQGFVILKYAQSGLIGIIIGIMFIFGAFLEVLTYYEDEQYLKKGIAKEKVRVKTVLLHEIITDRSSASRYSCAKKYLKISYLMGDEMITRELSEFHYDINSLEYDLVGLYGKKITIVYYNKEFYILNHVYLEYDDEEIKPEGKDELLNNSETKVRNLVESKDEEQIKRKKLQEELRRQLDYQLSKYCSIIFIVIGAVILLITGIHSRWNVVVGGVIGIFLVFRFVTWTSCRKHSGGIWDRAKLRNVQKEIDKKL